MKKAKEILREVEVFPEEVEHIKIENKIYIKILLETEKFLTIEKVSQRIIKLLGYSSSSLRGLNISILLPEFYRAIHETLIKEKVYNMAA